MLSNHSHPRLAAEAHHLHVGPLRKAPGRLLRLVWRDRLIGVGLTIVVAALAGLLIALLMPWGPITTTQALTLIGVALATGFIGGVTLRSRWTMLLTPVVQVAVFELARSTPNLPTTGAIHFDTSYGIIAFLLSRGVYAFFGLLPMVLGVVYGAALARWLNPMPAASRRRWRAGRYIRRGVGGLSSAAVIALVVLLLLPASTPALPDQSGSSLGGGVNELTTTTLGGHQQWLEIRGQRTAKPVLLYLSGGPGQSDLPFSRVFFADLTKDFVVVGWDQRGTGKSYPSLDPKTFTLDRAVADTVELTNYLRQRFHQQKIYLLGESWGSILGVLAAQQHPELYYAFIGSGQMVSPRKTDQRIYQDLMAYAQRTGDTGLAKQLRSYGPPPYKDVWAYSVIMQNYPKLEGDYTPPTAYDERGSASGIGPWGLLGQEYTLIEKVNVMRGLLDMYSVMYPQLQGIDFQEQVPRLEVPVYLLEGDHELAGRRDLAVAWFNALQAPRKQLFTFADAGHSTAFEEFQPLQRIMTGVVLPQTLPGPVHQ